MRVLHVTARLGPEAGGVARALLPLCAAQAAAGAEVGLFGVGAAPALPLAGVRVEVRPARAPQRLCRSPQLREVLLREPADVVHAHGLWLRPLAYAREAAARARVPLVISPLGMLTPWALRRSRLLKWLARRVVHPGALRAAAGWHVTSRLEAEDVARSGLPGAVCLVPHGIDPEAGDPERARRHYLEAAPELADRRVLLFYSRFHPKKRVRELIRDFAALASRHADWQLLVVGLPEVDDVAGLRGLARSLGVAQRVSVLDGSDRPAPWSVAELMVLPTHSENFGLVVLEALAAGVPVLTTTGTPWQELDQVGAGVCVPIPELPLALEALMARSAPELRAAGARGRAWAARNFDAARSAERLLDFYASLRAGPAGGAAPSP